MTAIHVADLKAIDRDDIDAHAGISDGPILVRDGVAYDVPYRLAPHAPECIWEGFADGAHIESGTGWTLIDGYSGQHGYSGPIMHASEYIGGRMVDAILAMDGWYVAVACETLDDGDEPAGWALAHRDE